MRLFFYQFKFKDSLKFNLVSYALLIIIGLFILFFPQKTLSQDVTQERKNNIHAIRSITGQILDEDNNPIMGVTIELHELNKGCLSDSLGFFKIEGVPAGIYHLHLLYPMFKPITQSIDIRQNNFNHIFFLSKTHAELSEIIIEADPLKTDSKEQSLIIESINESFLLKNTTTNLISTLSKIPGINQINVGTGIAKPVIRGMSLNRIAVVDNGIKQEGQQWGSDHGLEIDALGIQQLEIIKGPSALIYGSDAIGGVVQLKSALPKRDIPLLVSLQTGFQSVNQNFPNSLYIQKNFKEGLCISARFSLQDYGDFHLPASSFTYNRFVLPIYNKVLKNTAGKEKNFNFTAGCYRNWGYSKITLSYFNQNAGMFSGAFGIPRTLQLIPDSSSRNIDLPSTIVQHTKFIWNTNILFKKNWLEIDLGFQNNNRIEKATSHTHGFAFDFPYSESLTLLLNTYNLNTRYHHSLIPKTNGVIGLSSSYQTNKHGGYEFFLSDFINRQIGLFIYEKIDFNRRLHINVGARYDIANINIKAYDEPIRQSNGDIIRYQNLVPQNNRDFDHGSCALGMSYFPKEYINIKLNLATVFRFPSPSELSSKGIHHGTFRFEQGNPNLSPEKGLQSDLSLSIEQKLWMLKISGFACQFQNYLYLSPTPYFSVRRDAGQIYEYYQTPALNYGGEAFIDLHPIKSLNISIGLDYVKNINKLTNLPLPFTPAPKIRTELDYTINGLTKKENSIWKIFKNLNISLEYIHTTAQSDIDRNELKTPSSNIWNVKYSFNIQLPKQEKFLRVFFQINNLFDIAYFSHLSRYRLLNLPEPGRNFALNLVWHIESQKRK